MKKSELREMIRQELKERNEFMLHAYGTDYYFHRRKDEDLNEELYRLLAAFFKKNSKHAPKRVDITW